MRMPPKTENGAKLVKVAFPLEATSWHGVATETMWAETVGENLYRLRNSPFYAFGVSAEDVVSAKLGGGLLIFSDVVQRSYHSTYRVFRLPQASDKSFRSYWEQLEELGCTYEQGDPEKLFAIDVPPQADIYSVYDVLERGEASEVWGFEEGHCGHTQQR